MNQQQCLGGLQGLHSGPLRCGTFHLGRAAGEGWYRRGLPTVGPINCARFLLQSACIEGGSCYDSNVVGFGVPWKNPITQSLVLHRTVRELVTEVVVVSFAIQHWCFSLRGNHRTHLWHICLYPNFILLKMLLESCKTAWTTFSSKLHSPSHCHQGI